MGPLPGGQVQPVKVCAVQVACCSSKHIQVAIDDDHRLERDSCSFTRTERTLSYLFSFPSRNVHHLSVYLAGLLPSAAEQVPSFVLDIADVDIVPVVLAKGNPGATEHKQVVPVQNGYTGQRGSSVTSRGSETA